MSCVFWGHSHKYHRERESAWYITKEGGEGRSREGGAGREGGRGGGRRRGKGGGGGERRRGREENGEGRGRKLLLPTHVFPEAAACWREGVACSLVWAPYSCLGTGTKGEIGHWERYQAQWLHRLGCDATCVGTGRCEYTISKCSSVLHNSSMSINTLEPKFEGDPLKDS